MAKLFIWSIVSQRYSITLLLTFCGLASRGSTRRPMDQSMKKPILAYLNPSNLLLNALMLVASTANWFHMAHVRSEMNVAVLVWLGSTYRKRYV